MIIPDGICSAPCTFLIFVLFLFLERHIIAALYFNFNLLREVKKNTDDTEQVKVVWPKFKNGEATVRDVKVEPNFGKIFCMYKVMLGSLL